MELDTVAGTAKDRRCKDMYLALGKGSLRNENEGSPMCAAASDEAEPDLPLEDLMKL